MVKEYRTINEVVDPLMIVEKVTGVKYEGLVKVRMQNGEIRQGQILGINGDKAMVQIFKGTNNINIRDSGVRFLGHPLELGASPDMMGHVFDGLGRLKDSGPELLPEKRLDINGEVISPVAHDYPDEFTQTGISAINHLNALARGQKLPVFSASGLPRKGLATQIAKQADVLDSKEGFAVVFAAIGITFEEVGYFTEGFRQTGAIDRSALFVSLANDPAIERIVTPRMALTAAEYLVYEKGMYILAIMTDTASYCGALREISTARREVSGRRGYPGYFYTNLATLYGRVGRTHGSRGSVTQIPILTMSEEDKTHPIPDLTDYITEGQIILSRELYKSDIQLPIDVLPSLSRLKDKGTGEDETRGDHTATMNQLFSAYAQGKQARELVVILGESALSDVNRIYAAFAQRLEEECVNQGFNTNHLIEETLDPGWELLSILPRTELKRIKEDMLDQYLTEGK